MDYVVIGICFIVMGFVFGFTLGLFTLETIQKKIKDKTNEKNNK